MFKMDEKKIIKFNMYMSLILLVTFILMFVGVTIAYFSNTKQAKSTFVAGNVEIELTESVLVRDDNGNLVAHPEGKRTIYGSDDALSEYGVLYPGQSVHKDPVIKNIGDDPEWIAAKLTITDGKGDLTKVLSEPGDRYIDISMLLGGGLLGETGLHYGTWNGIEGVTYDEHFAMIQVPKPAEGKFEFYFFIQTPVEPKETVCLFETLAFPIQWNNAEMQHLADTHMEIQAFGVQTFELESCLVAMRKAFPGYFNFS